MRLERNFRTEPRFERLRAIGGLERHLEVGRHTGASWHRVDDGRHVAGGQSTARQRLATHVDALLRCDKGLLAWCPEAAKHSHAACDRHEHRQGATLGSHCDQTSDYCFQALSCKDPPWLEQKPRARECKCCVEEHAASRI